MEEEALIQYNLLLENSELHTLFPEATGNWKKDSKDFLKIYKENIAFLEDCETDFEEVDVDE